MSRHEIRNYTDRTEVDLEAMAWELADQSRVSRNDIPEDFRGTTRYTAGAFVKEVTDCGGPLGSLTVYIEF